MEKGKIILTELRNYHDGMKVVFDQGHKRTVETLMIVGHNEFGLEGDCFCTYDGDELKLLAVEYAEEGKVKTKLISPEDYDAALELLGEEVYWERQDRRIGTISRDEDGFYSSPIIFGDWAKIIPVMFKADEAFRMAFLFADFWLEQTPEDRARLTINHRERRDWMNKWYKENKNYI